MVLFETLLLFFRPILIGMLGGFVYFIIQPTKCNAHKVYSLSVNYVILGTLFLASIVAFRESIDGLSLLSSQQTNAVFNVFCAVMCLLTSVLLFCNASLPRLNIDNRFLGKLIHRLSLGFIIDLNFYWTLLNAYVIAMYYDSSTSIILPIVFGFTLFFFLRDSIMHTKNTDKIT